MAYLSTAGSVVLAILIFIFAISFIVAVHEAGHLSAAKIFGVYCFDYSIGFGPKIFRKRKRGAETYFTFRAIPLGGFVSMYGEGDPSEEEKEVYIPPCRSLNGISHPKKFVVMGAGVFLNFILGFLILLFANAALPHMTIFNSTASTTEQYKIEQDFYKDTGYSPLVLSYKDGEDTYLESIVLKNFTAENSQQFWVIDDNVAYNNERYFLCRTAAPASYTAEQFFKNFVLYKGKTDFTSESDKRIWKELDPSQKDKCIPDYSNEASLLKASAEVTGVSFDYKFYKSKTEKTSDGKTKYIFDSIKDYVTEPDCKLITKQNGSDLSYYYSLEDNSPLLKRNLYMKEMWYSGGDVWRNTGYQFGKGCALIFSTLGKLFQPSTFKQVSGPVGIVKQTASILQNYNAYTLFYFFGLISINLGIINLLPFPGLDGWHLFVCLFEGISKKNIPNKVKNWVSIIGLILLFGFSIVIIIKDIIGLF